MNKEDFIDELADIAASGYEGFSSYQREEYTRIFNGIDKKILKEWLDEFYNQEYGLDEGVSGEEINWVAEYLGQKAKVIFE